MAGLTTALLLSKSGKYNIVVAAKHMPGDYDIEYASPWAGANYMPYVHQKVLNLLDRRIDMVIEAYLSVVQKLQSGTKIAGGH